MRRLALSARAERAALGELHDTAAIDHHHTVLVRAHLSGGADFLRFVDDQLGRGLRPWSARGRRWLFVWDLRHRQRIIGVLAGRFGRAGRARFRSAWGAVLGRWKRGPWALATWLIAIRKTEGTPERQRALDETP